MDFPKNSDNSQFCQSEQRPILVRLMTHHNSDVTPQKVVTVHEISLSCHKGSSLTFSLKMA